MRSSILMLSAAILAAVLFAGRPTVRSEEAEREQAAVVIECLLDHISGSKSVFIRNGKQYTSEQAAGHIRKKYEHFREDIETPEDFQRVGGSDALLPGFEDEPPFVLQSFTMLREENRPVFVVTFNIYTSDLGDCIHFVVRQQILDRFHTGSNDAGIFLVQRDSQ